jgi:hypothetical protein
VDGTVAFALVTHGREANFDVNGCTAHIDGDIRGQECVIGSASAASALDQRPCRLCPFGKLVKFVSDRAIDDDFDFDAAAVLGVVAAGQPHQTRDFAHCRIAADNIGYCAEQALGLCDGCSVCR